MSCFREDGGDARKGRRALATRALREGARVLRTSPAACATLVACGWCLRRAPALSRCGGCKLLRYCSRRCQQRDWAEGGHARECAGWRGVGERPQTLLLVARLTARLYLDKEGGEAKREVERLRDHVDDHEPAKLEQFREMAQLVLAVLARSKLNVDKKSIEELRGELLERVVRLFCRVNCNAFTICDDANTPVGIGLFPHGALFNHSCEPNCVVGFRGREMVVHAIRPIAKDEELTVSYVELLESSRKRRRALRESYFFDCDCARCELATASRTKPSEDWYLDGLSCSGCNEVTLVVPERTEGAIKCWKCGASRSSADILRSQDSVQSLQQQLANSNIPPQQRWDLHQQLWRVARQELCAHPRNTLIANISRDIGNFLMDADVTALSGQPRALPFFLSELEATEWIVPDVKLPSRGLLHLQIAKLMLEESSSKPGYLEDANRHVKRALSIIGIACGSDCSMLDRAAIFQQDIERLRSEISS